MASQTPLVDLSVLVSCYNKIDYVDRCFSSLEIMQQLGAEVIVVDDGSIDGSYERLSTLNVKARTPFKIIHTKNQGAGPARRLAVQHSTKTYCFFLDIDDLPEHTNLATLLAYMKNTNSDLAVGNYINLNSGELGPMPQKLSSFESKNLGDLREEILISMGWWRYLYRRDFLNLTHNRIGDAFDDFGDRKFVLDDLFWMIHLASQNLNILVSPYEHYIYLYDLPLVHNKERWRSYLNQVSYLAEAAEKFIGHLNKSNCNHNNQWILSKIEEQLWDHLSLLRFSKYRYAYTRTYRFYLRFNSRAKFEKYLIGFAKYSVAILKNLKRELLSLKPH